MTGDPALFTGLLNIGTAAIASVIVAFFEPTKNVRAALFTVVCVTALANFHIQRNSTATLNSQIEALQVNHWDILTESEGKKFAAALSGSKKSNKRLQVVCAFAGCSDLAQNIRVWAGKGGWAIEIVPPIFGPPEAPLEYWYYEDSDLDFLTALENATRPRFQIVRKRFDHEVDQINLFIGYKP